MSRPAFFRIVVLLCVATLAICAAAEPGDDAVPPTEGDSRLAPGDDSTPAISRDSQLPPDDKLPPSPDASQLPPDDADLPWTHQSDGGRPPANVRELLPNVSEGDLAGLHDGEPIETDGLDVLYRLLERTQGITPLNFQRFAEAEPIWQQLADDPPAHRLAVVELSGRAKQVERLAMPPDAADLFSFSHYYRITLAIDEAPGPVVFYARRAPSAWPLETPIDEPASAFGLFFKLAESHPVFVGYRLAWFPEKVVPDAGITDDHLLLAKCGMDIGLLDDLRALNGKELVVADREPFYQLLAAVSRIDPRELASRRADPIDLQAAITQPERQHGKLTIVEGVARRISRLEVPDADVQSRFGIDAYYLIEVFVPLGNLTIRMGEPSDDSDKGLIRNRYPVTVCVPRLPVELAEYADKRGDQALTREVRIRAFSYRLWSYRSQFASQLGGQSRQVGPMLIGTDLVVTEEPSAFPAYMTAIVAGVFLVALASIWLVLWRTSRRDARMGRKLVPRGDPTKPTEPGESSSDEEAK